MTPIYRTVYQVEVFSEGEYEPHDDDNMSDLTSIDYDITYGDHIGNVKQISSEIVAPADVEKEMLRIANDGSFFGRFCVECKTLVIDWEGEEPCPAHPGVDHPVPHRFEEH